VKNLFEMQKTYNDKIYENRELTPHIIERITQELSLCAHAEISSLISATGYKKHHSSDFSLRTNEAKILYESVDVIRYIMAIMNLWNIDYSKFEAAFKKKDIYLNTRKRIDDNPWDGRPVAIIDVDDVISEFRTGFASWLSNTKDIHPDISSREYYFIDALSQSGVNPEEIFEEFISVNGFSCFMIVREGVKEFLHSLREMGYWIHLLTARPEENLICLYDTYEWLHDHNIPFDDISFSGEKFRWCAKSKYYNSDSIVFAIDDSPKHVMEYAVHGIKCFVPMKSYNTKTWGADNVQAYDNFNSLLNLIKSV